MATNLVVTRGTYSDKNFDTAVFIGRFQPWHNGHLALLRHALASARRVVVVIGSAYRARTPKNPFTWQERAEMVRLSLSAADCARIDFLPVRDYYDQERWVAAVQRGVTALILKAPNSAVHGGVALVGHFKDATSSYLRSFPEWRLVDIARQTPVDATALRNIYFGSSTSEGHAGYCVSETALSSLIGQAPASTVQFLRAWSRLPFYSNLCAEWRMLRDYRAAWSNTPFPPVFVTVDAVVHCAGHVLLIRRGRSPGLGLHAVPGGFLKLHETLYQSAARELLEKTGLRLLDSSMRHCLQNVSVFDHPDRSELGRVVSHAHYFDLGERALPELGANNDAAAAMWIPIKNIGSIEDECFDDHFHMLEHFP